MSNMMPSSESENTNSQSYFGQAHTYVSNNLGQAHTFVSNKFAEGWGPYPPPGKAGQLAYGCQDYSEAPMQYINTLKSDLANTYYWTGHCGQDYMFFICQWHPFIGMFLSHPYHPWSKRERIQMFLISLACTLVPSVAIAKKAHDAVGGGLEKGMQTVLTIFFITIPDTIIGVVLYQLSIMDTRCPICADCWKWINFVLMNCSLIFWFAASGVCYLMLKDTEIDFVKAISPLFMGKLYSGLTWFPIWFLMPCVGYILVWRSEKFALEKAAQSNAAAE